MAELAPKKVVLSQIIEDLRSGLTKWKKDDIGFGSLEKKYNLQQNEMIELLGHPKLKGVETRIPAFQIIDDLPEPDGTQPGPIPELLKTEVEVSETVVQKEPVIAKQTMIVVKSQPIEKPKATPVAFI